VLAAAHVFLSAVRSRMIVAGAAADPVAVMISGLEMVVTRAAL
jgi:hypothetical protein